MDDLYLLSQHGVLGSVLLTPDIAGDVIAALRPEDFTEELGRQVFLAIRNLYLDGGKIDLICILDRMGAPDPEKRAYLLQLMDETPTSANFREYLAIVRERSRIRTIQNCVGAELISAGLTMDRARELYALFGELLVDRRGVECLSMEQGILNFQEEMARTPSYLPWGISFLDEGLTVETGGDYVVIGGYPSDGKTALALSMAYKQAEKLRVGFFSLETKASKLFNRVYSAAAQVSGARIKRRALTEEDCQKLEQKADELVHHRLHLIRSSSMTVEDIAFYTRARRFQVVYVDYLTLVQAPGRTEFEQATYISKALHRLAQDNNITVVALSQLSRGEDEKKPRPPTLRSLRSSGQIEQDADVVMLLYREEPGRQRSRRILRVAKNKEGETGPVPLLFNGETMTFRVDQAGLVRDCLRREPENRQQAFWDIPGSDKMQLEEAGRDTKQAFGKDEKLP